MGAKISRQKIRIFSEKGKIALPDSFGAHVSSPLPNANPELFTNKGFGAQSFQPYLP